MTTEPTATLAETMSRIRGLDQHLCSFPYTADLIGKTQQIPTPAVPSDPTVEEVNAALTTFAATFSTFRTILLDEVRKSRIESQELAALKSTIARFRELLLGDD